MLRRRRARDGAAHGGTAPLGGTLKRHASTEARVHRPGELRGLSGWAAHPGWCIHKELGAAHPTT